MGYAQIIHKSCAICLIDLYSEDATGHITYSYGHGRIVDGVRVFSMCALCDPNPELHKVIER